MYFIFVALQQPFPQGVADKAVDSKDQDTLLSHALYATAGAWAESHAFDQVKLTGELKTTHIDAILRLAEIYTHRATAACHQERICGYDGAWMQLVAAARHT